VSLLRGYAIVQVLTVAVVWLLPTNGWWQAIWDAVAGWGCALFVVIGVRRHRPPRPGVWYAVGVGLFLNACGSLVEMIAWRGFGVTTNPNAADVFWLALYPGVLVCLGNLLYARIAAEDTGMALLNTLVCVLLNVYFGIFAWDFIVWGTGLDPNVTWANRLIVTVYPLADMALVALALRLLLGGGYRQPPLVFLVAAFACLVGSDLGWAAF